MSWSLFAFALGLFILFVLGVLLRAVEVRPQSGTGYPSRTTDQSCPADSATVGPGHRGGGIGDHPYHRMGGVCGVLGQWKGCVRSDGGVCMGRNRTRATAALDTGNSWG